MTALLLLWFYGVPVCSVVGNDCGVVQSKRVVEQAQPMTAVATGSRHVVVRERVPARVYLVTRRWCFSECSYVPTETDARGYDRATNDHEWMP